MPPLFSMSSSFKFKPLVSFCMIKGNGYFLLTFLMIISTTKADCLFKNSMFKLSCGITLGIPSTVYK